MTLRQAHHYFSISAPHHLSLRHYNDLETAKVVMPGATSHTPLCTIREVRNGTVARDGTVLPAGEKGMKDKCRSGRMPAPR